MSRTFKTPKGTELPLRDMKGKDYLDVPYRVQWMREEHQDWGIETSFLTLNKSISIAHATIRDASGRILAQGTKTETPQGFADYVEKSETGAVGRALALCGYGTQFAQELCEEDRIVDSPKERPASRGDAIPSFPAPKLVGGDAPACPQCQKRMMVSKYQANTWYCIPCKKNVPMGA